MITITIRGALTDQLCWVEDKEGTCALVSGDTQHAAVPFYLLAYVQVKDDEGRCVRGDSYPVIRWEWLGGKR